MRILIVDDEPAMHASYRQCFGADRADDGGGELIALAAELFGDAEDGAPAVSDGAAASFDCTFHMQGIDAVEAVSDSIQRDARYAVAFIDVRMPPGIDGKETAKRIRALDPDINLVIVTGYSDFSPLDISRAAGPTDKIFYLAKPFQAEEVIQTATALGHRWQVDKELEAARTALAEKVALLEEQKLELAANESRAIHMAHHDSLTEAPNRLAFLQALSAAVKDEHCFAMALLDLDRFKLVNDTLGHLVGDELLRMTCDLLREGVPEGGFVARLGGDEFAMLFHVTGEDEAVMCSEKLLKACSASFKVMGHSVQGGASIGLVVIEPGSTGDPIDVLRRADLALNEAKRQGRGIVRLFDESMDESIRFRRQIETGLSGAIANGEIKLVFQPIIRREGLEITGFEALIRWCSPDYGMVPPQLFIPVAEESNLIHELGDWVTDAAVQALKTWPGHYVSVNFSPRQFRRPNFVGHLIERITNAGVDPRRFQIEITETAIFDNVERAAQTLFKLRQMGFRIALDDFGTGYSSLYNIRRFALDCLKIDRSFVDGMARERESAAIVRSIIHLGRSLGMEVVAEGVETPTQLEALYAAGCSHMQGFYLSRPVDADDALVLAQKRFLATSVQPEAAAGNGTNG